MKTLRLFLCPAAALLLTFLCPLPTRSQTPDPGTARLEREVVERLAGAADLLPGVRLSDRTTPENRALARDYLAALLDSLGLESRRQTYRENGENVYALLPATVASEEYLVLGAHFDSARLSPGANDNATGCALVAGAARDLVRLPGRSRNLYIIFFDEEERGLQGSRAFAGWLQAEGKTVVGVHTVDQMGWDADKDRAVELEIPYEGAVPLYEEAARAMGRNIILHVTAEAGSDHSAFRRLGFPAVGLTEEYRSGDTTPHIHRSTDRADTVDFDYLASSTRLVVSAFRRLLNGGEDPGAGPPG